MTESAETELDIAENAIMEMANQAVVSRGRFGFSPLSSGSEQIRALAHQQINDLKYKHYLAAIGIGAILGM